MITGIEDRLAITDVLHGYAGAVDAGDWTRVEGLFTSDAEADFGALGGVKRGSRHIARFCARALGGFDAVQHIIGNVVVTPECGVARASCSVLAVHVASSLAEPFLVGGVYNDVLRKADDSQWRIAQRTLVICWWHGAPEGLHEA